MTTIQDFKHWSKMQGQALKIEARRNWFLSSATVLLSIVSLSLSVLVFLNYI